MGGNGKKPHRWKISIYRSSKSSSSSSSSSSASTKMAKQDPPQEFICPISNSLMFDPVVVSSGQTFERASVQVCKELGYSPRLPDNSVPDFSAVIPNLALKTSIINWCKQHADPPYPFPPEYTAIETKIRNLMGVSGYEDPRIRVSERELLKSVADRPQIIYSHAATELYPRNNHHHFYSSSSSEESVIANTSPLHPFVTRPLCYSSASTTPMNSSEIISDGVPNAEEESFISKLKSLDVFEQEQALVQLRKTTRTDEETRVLLCTHRLLDALRPHIGSRYSVCQTNATAALVNLSLAKANKVKIVRAGMVPVLIDVLKGGVEEAQEHSAGAIFSLALDDENKTAIGVLGALQPLLLALRTGSERTRHDSALALYHLTLVQSNRAKLIKMGAAGVLLGVFKNGGDLAGRVVLVICNLAVCPEGKSALLDANAVQCLLGLLKDRRYELGHESTRENCVAALYSLSQGSLRFKGLAKEARAVEVLQEVVERGSERAREKAKRMLIMLKGRGEEEEDGEVDWEGLMENGLSRYRVGRHGYGPNSTEF